MNDLLAVLGKRVRELRAAKKWSQEELAHISGLHRTYIGQIERGEKNISFGNLSKISSVFDVTLAELLSGLEDGGTADRKSKRAPGSRSQLLQDATRRTLETQKLVRRLRLQHAVLDRTIVVLEKLAVSDARTPTPSRERSTRRGTRAAKE